MAWESAQKTAWALARRQNWVITRRQLLALGFTPREIDLRIEAGRLHPIHVGVYAVGRPDLSRAGHLIAAVLACADAAALSDDSAAEHWEIRPRRAGPIDVSVPAGSRHPRRPGIKVRRRVSMEITEYKGIRVTTPACTIVDIAPRVTEEQLERAINEAANRDLVTPDRLGRAVAGMTGRRGAPKVAALLDRHTYVVTDTRLEQRLLRIVREAGLPDPETQRRHPGGRVDFYWPGLKLIVEADSLRFHRTPAQQAEDRLRDQQNTAAGLTTLRFTHWQIFREPEHVRTILVRVAQRLAQ
jgi:very-short-patch-repair endonuclease